MNAREKLAKVPDPEGVHSLVAALLARAITESGGAKFRLNDHDYAIGVNAWDNYRPGWLLAGALLAGEPVGDADFRWVLDVASTLIDAAKEVKYPRTDRRLSHWFYGDHLHVQLDVPIPQGERDTNMVGPGGLLPPCSRGSA